MNCFFSIDSEFDNIVGAEEGVVPYGLEINIFF